MRIGTLIISLTTAIFILILLVASAAPADSTLPSYDQWKVIDKRSVNVGNFLLDITYYEYETEERLRAVIFYESTYVPDPSFYNHKSLFWYDSKRETRPHWRTYVEEKGSWLEVEEFHWQIELMPSTGPKPSLVLVFSYKPLEKK